MIEGLPPEPTAILIPAMRPQNFERLVVNIEETTPEPHVTVWMVGTDDAEKELMRLVEVLEACLGKKAKINPLPLQPGDVPATFADADDLARDVGFQPQTPIEEGVKRFVQWYREYYSV